MGRLEQLEARMVEVRTAIEGARYVGVSEDERIRVTVNSRGRLEDVELDPRLFRSPVDTAAIAARIVAATSAACELADAGTTELLLSALGPEARVESGAGDLGGLAQMAAGIGRHLRAQYGQELDDRRAGSAQ